MKRRGFLATLLGLVAAPLLPALPAIRGEISGRSIAAGANPLFRGEFGRWEGVKITATPEAARVFSRHLWADSRRVRFDAERFGAIKLTAMEA